MNLPHWVEKQIEALHPDFTVQIVIACGTGGVTRMETKTCHQVRKRKR